MSDAPVIFWDRKTRYNTVNNRPKTRGEINTAPSVTDRKGYIPAKSQIEGMMLAGQRLDAYRRTLYDFDYEDDIPDGYTDPTRAPGFDVIDAEQLDAMVKDGIRRTAAEAKAEAARIKMESAQTEQTVDNGAISS